MVDTVDIETRSKIMSRIRSKGNRSTELKMRMILVKGGISSWRVQPESILGNPDFIFPNRRIALFVDGCFWHGCPQCGHIPKTNEKYWQNKILRNIERDKKLSTELINEDWLVVRIWEHELKFPSKVLLHMKLILSGKNKKI